MPRTPRCALVGLSCALVFACAPYDPVAACESNCETQKAEGCFPAELDCVGLCGDADVRYEAEREIAESQGCAGEYDRLTNCENGGDLCDSTRCADENSAFGVCLVGP